MKISLIFIHIDSL